MAHTRDSCFDRDSDPRPTLDVSSEDLEPGLPTNMPTLPEIVAENPELVKLGTKFPIAEIGTAQHPISLPPTAHDAPPLAKAGFTPGTLLMVLAGAAVVAIPFLGASTRSTHSSQTESGLPAAAPPARPPAPAATTNAPAMDVPALSCSDSTGLENEQLVQLNAMPITTTSKTARPEPAEPTSVAAKHANTDAASKTVSAPSPTKDRKAKSAAVTVPKKSFFDGAAATEAVRNASSGMSECGGMPGTRVNVAVTFAPTGTATLGVVESGDLMGTPAGSCVAQRLRGIQAPAFDGDNETVHTTLVLP